MGKVILVLLLVAVVVGWWWVGQRRLGVRRREAERLQAITPCAHCGLHVPTHEAVMRDGQSYCSAAHRELGPPTA